VSDARASAPATVLITRRVRRGRAQELERSMAGMQAAAASSPGHMGGFLVPPERAEQGCYRVLFAFYSQAHLQDWTQSRERQRWLRRIAGVTHGDAATRVLSALETWFELPAARTKSPPLRWKMAVVTWLGIFPLVLLSSHTIAPVLGARIHPLPVTPIVTGAITVAMNWLVMAMMVPLFHNRLYPKATESDATASPNPEEQ
jgi:uncharacterized protein